MHLSVLGLLALAIVYQACYERLPIRGFVYPRPEWLTRVADAVRFRQGWTMFAPHPPGETDLIVVDATTASGERVDPFQGTWRATSGPSRRCPARRV